MTNAAQDSNIDRVPIRECPHCGVRQYAQVSYLADLECVVCGGVLDAAHAAAWKSWPVRDRGRELSEGSSNGQSAQARLAQPDYGN